MPYGATQRSTMQLLHEDFCTRVSLFPRDLWRTIRLPSASHVPRTTLSRVGGARIAIPISSTLVWCTSYFCSIYTVLRNVVNDRGISPSVTQLRKFWGNLVKLVVVKAYMQRLLWESANLLSLIPLQTAFDGRIARNPSIRSNWYIIDLWIWESSWYILLYISEYLRATLYELLMLSVRTLQAFEHKRRRLGKMCQTLQTFWTKQNRETDWIRRLSRMRVEGWGLRVEDWGLRVKIFHQPVWLTIQKVCSDGVSLSLVFVKPWKKNRGRKRKFRISGKYCAFVISIRLFSWWI